MQPTTCAQVQPRIEPEAEVEKKGVLSPAPEQTYHQARFAKLLRTQRSPCVQYTTSKRGVAAALSKPYARRTRSSRPARMSTL
eukprot:1157340-Pelagomonas_calceolata.AAC.5